MLIALFQDAGDDEWTPQLFSEKNACAHCGISFDALTARQFLVQQPVRGVPDLPRAWARCMVFDEDLVVPDRDEVAGSTGRSRAWRPSGRRLRHLPQGAAAGAGEALRVRHGHAVRTSCRRSSAKLLLHGSGEEEIELGFWRGGAWRKYSKPFEGVMPNLQRRYEETESDYMRQKLTGYMSRQPCTGCRGARLRPESAGVHASAGKSIVEVMAHVGAGCGGIFRRRCRLTEQEAKIAAEILKEIAPAAAISWCDVGLDYLTLDRESGTLSGGEAQRIRLATQIGAGLVGVLYVLDEPSIGLHQRDNEKLMRTLKGLRDLGNTVVVVEHDEQTIREADYVIDLGPGAGAHGGEVVFAGPVPELLKSKTSLTAQFLNGEVEIDVPHERTAAGRGVAGGPRRGGEQPEEHRRADSAGAVRLRDGRVGQRQEHAGGRHPAAGAVPPVLRRRRSGRASTARSRAWSISTR